jgi:hypothetical protein
MRWIVLMLALACNKPSFEPMPEMKAHARTHVVQGRVEGATPRAVTIRDASGRAHKLLIDPASRTPSEPVTCGAQVTATVVGTRREVLRDLEVQ